MTLPYFVQLAKLWTKLGGNRRKLSVFTSHLILLNNISNYRKMALLRVTSTMLQLRQLSSDLDDLRDRVAAPPLVGEDSDESGIPIEVHIESIRKGVERLEDYRKRSVQRWERQRVCKEADFNTHCQRK